ncbi:H(+)/Cl(-) exchange transporter 3-like isoform X2 [Zophobas morio]|uniref:H(+)/Cl(-) exchange transporter 3-like isoform X2 n=1 Tax=Zophobas morio TaxID=2755281 RepID=UPI003082CA5A
MSQTEPEEGSLLLEESAEKLLAPPSVSEFPIFNQEAAYDDFTTIDWFRDLNQERNRQRILARKKRQNYFGWIRKILGDAWQGWLVTFLVGITVGGVSGFVDFLVQWLNDLKFGVCCTAFWLNKANCDSWKSWTELISVNSNFLAFIFYAFWMLLFSVLSGVLVVFFAPFSAGSGISEVKTILSGFVIRRFLNFNTLIVKIIGTCLSVSAGLSLGKEGPFVHIASCLGNVFSIIFEKYRCNEAKKRELLSAAAASGVSVAFGAPIGGVLFSLEEVSYYFPHKTMWRSFFCALTAASVLKYLDPARTGCLVNLSVDYTTPWHVCEIPAFFLIGLLGGVYGSLFVKANVWWNRYRATCFIRRYPIREILVIASLTAVCKYPIHLLRMNTTDSLKLLLSKCTSSSTLLDCNEEYFKAACVLIISVAFTLILTALTFGIQVPAGIFIPSMSAGAMMGRLVGIFFQWLRRNSATLTRIFPCKNNSYCINPGLYALCGAAAGLGGVTRMSVSLAVILFELTGGLTYIIPIMITIVTSKWIGDACGTSGIYDEHIRLKGYPFLDSKCEYSSTTTAREILHPQHNEPPLCVLLEKGNTVGSLKRLLKESPYKGFPLIDNLESRGSLGFVNRIDLTTAIEKISESTEVSEATSVCFTLKDWKTYNLCINLAHINTIPIQVSEEMPLDMIVDLFRKLGVRYLLVVTHGELIGLITKKDLLKHLASVYRQDPELILYY